LRYSYYRQATNSFKDIVENLWQISDHIFITIITIIWECLSFFWFNLKPFFDLIIHVNHIIIHSIKFMSWRLLTHLI
jgi:hypothetical protein